MDARKAALAVTIVVGATLDAAPAGAARGVELRVAAPPAQLIPGASFVARAHLRRVRQGSRVTFLLSRDRRRSRSDHRLGKPVKLRRARRAAVASRRVRVPASAAGAYRLLACVTARAPKRRCAASKRVLRVAAEAPQGLPAPPSPPPSAPPAEGDGRPPRGTTTFDLPADPLSASVTPGPQSETERVDPGGGTVAITAGGVEYELEIPEGALLTPEEITLRPVASFSGLPFAAEPLAGVVVTPAQVRLLEPAVLRIRNARTVPPAAQAGFAFRPDGTELHLTPLSLDPAAIELPVIRLGGFGVAEATPAERAAVTTRLPTGFEDRLAHLLAAQVAGVRAAARTRQAAPQDEIIELLGVSYEIVSSHIDAAVTDDAQLDDAISAFTAWYAHVISLDLEVTFDLEQASAQRRLRLALINAYRAAGARCAAGAPALPNFARVVKAELTLRALGYEYDTADLATQRSRCLDMQLDVLITTSTSHSVSRTCPDESAFTVSETASGQLRIDGMQLSPDGGALIAGSAPSRVTETYSRSTPNPCFGGTASCSESATDAARPAWETGVQLGLNAGDATGAPATFRLELEGRLTSPGPCTAFGGTGVGLSTCWFHDAACKQGIGLVDWRFVGSSQYQARIVADGTLSPAAPEVHVERDGTVSSVTAEESTTGSVELEATLR